MPRCPACRAQADPTLMTNCPECGATLAPTTDPFGPPPGGSPSAPAPGGASFPAPDPGQVSPSFPPPSFPAPDPGQGVPPSYPSPDPGQVEPPSGGGKWAAGAMGAVGAAGVATSRRGGFLGNMARGMGIRLVGALVVMGGLAGWGAFRSADRDDTGAITDAGDLGADQMAVGDCIDWPDADEEAFDTVRALPCADPHDAEVYALVSYPATAAAAYPGNDALVDHAIEACVNAFEGYVGIAYEMEPDLYIDFFTPTDVGWDDHDDRTTVCVAYDMDDEKLTGSVKADA